MEITKPTLVNALEHIGLGLAIGAVVAGGAVLAELPGPLWLGWAIQAAFWFGHEFRDQEIHLARAGYEGRVASLTAFFIWRWNADGRKDFLAPALALLPIPLLAG